MANYETLPGAIANGDMSTMQFGFVALSGSTSVDFEIAQSTEAILTPTVGILMNKPTSSGQPAEVAISGVAKLRFGGTIAQGGLIGAGAAGGGVANSTSDNNWVGAMALQNGTATGVYYVKILSPFLYSTQ